MKTKITVEDLVNFCNEKGCEVKYLKSFIKVTSPDQNKKAVYLGMAKRTFTRIDFSGFEMPEDGVIKRMSQEVAKSLNLGAVRGQILPKELPNETTDEEVWSSLGRLLDVLLDSSEGFKFLSKGERKSRPTPEVANDQEEDVLEAGLVEGIEVA